MSKYSGKFQNYEKFYFSYTNPKFENKSQNVVTKRQNYEKGIQKF